MMHQITVNRDLCRGPHCCYECERAIPGIIKYCEQHGRVLVSWESSGKHADTISNLIASCPDRAIVIKPMI